MSPKIVDTQRRRHEITDAYLDLIAREGLANASSRALASQLGIANGALWNYFTNKDDLLSAAAERVIRNTNSRIASVTQNLRGIPALEAMLLELLPLTKATRDEARTVVNFWGHAAIRVSERQRTAEFEWWRVQFASFIDQAQDDGDLRTDTPSAMIAALIVGYVTSAQIEYALDAIEPVSPLRPVHDILELCRTPETSERERCRVQS